MEIKLGINTGFALNRFTPPQDWIPLVSDVLGLKVVQFTADLLNPALPNEIIDDELDIIKGLLREYDVKIEHTFTSAFTRVNHLAHPSPAYRAYWTEWFCRFVDISVALGAESMGSHFGIFTVKDNNDPKKKMERFSQNIEGWKQIANYAKKKGLKYLTWEPMSISREQGETLQEAKRIHEIVNQDIAIPMKMCLDVDHGDLASSNPNDTDPYAWISIFADESPLIHLKQTLVDKSGHWPFTKDKNENGKIKAHEFVAALKEAGREEVTLLLELSFREREPFDSQIIDDIKESVEYWRPHVTI